MPIESGGEFSGVVDTIGLEIIDRSGRDGEVSGLGSAFSPIRVGGIR